MEIKIDFKSIDWWYWFVILIAIIIGLTWRKEGFYIVMLISTIQFIHFMIAQEFSALATQVRLVYTIFTILAFFLLPNLILYWILLVGTIMVVLFDRCMIAKVLLLMPWNKNLEQS